MERKEVSRKNELIEKFENENLVKLGITEMKKERSGEMKGHRERMEME